MAVRQAGVFDLGTSACPPYHLAICIGGTSAEMCLSTVKKASAGYLDELPTSGNEGGRCFRDLEWEEKVLKRNISFDKYSLRTDNKYYLP